MAGLHRISTAHDDAKDSGVLMLPIRKDDVSKLRDESNGTPYGDGNFAALEVDEAGYLRVKLPASGAAVSEAPTIEDLLTEQNSLLRRLVLAMELFHGTEISDPQM